MISEGIKVSVETTYQPEFSNPLQSEFVFSYHITIENHNNFSVKLLRRHWYIFDSDASLREVEGEGVVGVQPTILRGKRYEYTSSCNLNSEMGKMNGHYEMENLFNKKFFFVDIPAFEMIVPFKGN